MPAVIAAGAAFLVAVLWFDLMFDVQALKAGPVSPQALASIGGYYRRVTTEATPMNRLITAVMLLTLLATGAEIARAAAPAWIGWPRPPPASASPPLARCATPSASAAPTTRPRR
jgi:hypothetical protein